MISKIILMMPKNQELSKFQSFKNQNSRFKNQVSRLKIQESREDSIKISTKKVFSKHWVAQEVFTKSLPEITKEFYSLVIDYQ